MTTLLLASNSTPPGGAYLGHLHEAVVGLFAECRRVAFVPYALADMDTYAGIAHERFAELGIDLISVHTAHDPITALEASDAIFVGGGNSFRLLDQVTRAGLLEPVRSLVAAGHPYMGTSAGSNLACPTIMTTNDMPIVAPPSFEALGLIDFQINPHYVDRDPDVSHSGETRAQRIAEFHEEQPTPVIGLREGSWLSVKAGSAELCGPHHAVLFRAGHEPVPLAPGPIDIRPENLT